jgi:uncharacterized DUF497 family protein
MKFEWDAAKAAVNKRKHRVSFEEAAEVFFDPFVITMGDAEHSNIEDRELSIGSSARRRVVVVVHTQREAEVIRIISARKASEQEVSDYESEVERKLQS